jgi:ABC-type Mn2+/Zn2+ transport system permease subunit
MANFSGATIDSSSYIIICDRPIASLSSYFILNISQQSRVKVDAAMALTFSSFFAMGVLLINVSSG